MKQAWLTWRDTAVASLSISAKNGTSSGRCYVQFQDNISIAYSVVMSSRVPPHDFSSLSEFILEALLTSRVGIGLVQNLYLLGVRAPYLGLHLFDRQHDVVMASSNLLQPGPLTTPLYPLAQSLGSLAVVSLGPQLWPVPQNVS